MDHSKKALRKAAPAEPRQDRLLAVLLEGVLDMELTAARHQLERTSAPPLLVERALRLLRRNPVPEEFLASPFEPDRHTDSLEDLPLGRDPGA